MLKVDQATVSIGWMLSFHSVSVTLWSIRIVIISMMIEGVRDSDRADYIKIQMR